MKLYSTLKSFTVYNQNGFLLPKGDKPGFGNAVFLVSPSKNQGYDILKDSFLEYRQSLYKNYVIDFVYREKIGYKKYLVNKTGIFKKEFNEMEFPSPIRLVSNSNRVTIMKRQLNLLVNLGEWNDIYFKFQIKSSVEKICETYLQFLGNRINGDYNEYNKILYIDIDQWIDVDHKLAFDRRGLCNPLAILLVAMYKFPNTIRLLGNCDIVFASPQNSKIVKVNTTELSKASYTKLKQRILSMINNNVVDQDKLSDDIIDNGGVEVQSDDPLQAIVGKSKQRQEEIKKRVISSLTKNLLGDTEDITGDDEYDNDYESDDDQLNQMKEDALNYMDEHPELLNNMDEDMVLKEVTNVIKKKYYIHEFKPKYSDEKLKEIQRLQNIQISKIGSVEESFKNLESKKIDDTDFSDVVNTQNPNILKSKFVNFDRSYNNKKLEADIDNAVGHLANATIKVFVIDKQEEDTSTQMDLKKTLTYTLQDENGKKMKLKFDIPIIFDDHFLYIKGNKKILQHQLVLKPIVKTDDHSVQIVSNYKKIFVRRQGSIDLKTNALLRYIKSNSTEFDVIFGNGAATNTDFKSTLEYNVIASKIVEFRINNNLFILDIHRLLKQMKDANIKYDHIDLNKKIIIGIDLNTRKPICMNLQDSFSDKIISFLPDEMKESVKRISYTSNSGKLLMYNYAHILNKKCPLCLLLCYYEGFSAMMKRANIEYELIPKSDNALDDIDLYEWGITPLNNGYIKWKRYPQENSLLMNGFNHLPIEMYDIEELESKDTYINLLTYVYSYANQAFNLDQFKDFMIDPITKEILIDMGYPTELEDLLLIANRMLKSQEHTIESDLLNMRLRSNEIISYHVYQTITDAYRSYRKSQHKKSPNPITIKQDAVITSLSKADAGIMSDYSTLNPILEASKLHEVSYKGESGTNKDYSMTLDVRSYNESMLGIIGITSSPDSNVGVKRQLTLEPNITSTRGYIDVVGKDNVEELTGANLLTPAELLTPLGVQHDDPVRTSMSYKQSMYMLLVEDSDPVLIGNGVEKTIPYFLSSEFVVNAEDDGEIVDLTNEFIVIKYNNGKFRTIDLTMSINKNASSGFYIDTQLITNKKIGDVVKKNEIVAWDRRAFAKHGNELDVSMNLGPLVKIAIIPEWDIYEDSAPITHSVSERMASNMIMPVTVKLNKDSYVSQIAKIGDKINAGQSVITFDDYHEDLDVANLLKELREDLQEDIIESSATTKKSKYTGTIVDIKMYTTVELEELSDSLKDIVGEYWKKLKKREKFLDKYKNSDDCNFYKSGNLITESSTISIPDSQGKIKGEKVDDGVLIIFYVLFKDIMSRGDKLASEFALKSITSHVIDKGLEPYSEYQPDESIDLIVAPLSISARKTPSIFLAMFGNKCLIEAKRHLKDYWFGN